jgi:hypothetical protein
MRATVDELLWLGAKIVPRAKAREPRSAHPFDPSCFIAVRPVGHFELNLGVEHIALEEVPTRPAVVDAAHDLHVLVRHLPPSIRLAARPRKLQRQPALQTP